MNERELYQRQLNRERVRDFEKEMQGKLDGLDVIHENISKIGKLRKEWLEKISRMDDIDSDNFLKKLEAIKLQAELSSLNMKLDILRLEGHTEAQTLSYLVESTRPLETDESIEDRNAELARLAREHSEEMKEHLEQSLDYRIQLATFNYDLNKELEQHKREVQLEQVAKEEEFEDRVLKYMVKLQESMQRSQSHQQKITSEYLVLRHNARMTQEVLRRSQNDASTAREELQYCLDQIVAEAAEQRAKVEHSSEAELKLLTEDLRKEVMRKEAELEVLADTVRNLQRSKSRQNMSLLKRVRLFERKYERLQEKRRAQLAVVTSELARLRGLTEEVERRLASAGLDPELTTQAVSVSVQNNSTMLIKLKNRIKELRTAKPSPTVVRETMR